MCQPWGGVALVIAGFLLNLLVVGITLNYNILHLEMQHQFNATASQAGIIGGVAVGLLNLVSPLTTFICQVAGYRLVVSVGVVLTGTGLIASTFISQINFLIFSYGILLGFGSNFVHIPPLNLIMHYYSGKRYNRACVAMLTGIGAGIAITSPWIEKSISAYGLNNTLRMYGACTLFVGLISSMATRLPANKRSKHHHLISSNDAKINSNDATSKETQYSTPQQKYIQNEEGESYTGLLSTQTIYNVDTEIKYPETNGITGDGMNTERRTLFKAEGSVLCYKDFQKKEENTTHEKELKSSQSETIEKKLSQSEIKLSKILLIKIMLRSFNFWLCQPMFFLYAIGLTFSYVSVANFMDEKGMTSDEIASTLSFMGFGSLVTRVLFVLFASCLPVSVTFVMSLMSFTMFVISILLSLNIPNTFVIVLLIAVSLPRALLMVLVLPVCVELFGKDVSAEAMSLAYCFFGMGAFVTQGITDNLYDLTGSYNTTLHVCAVLYLISAISFGFAVFRSRRERRRRYKTMLS